MDTETAISRVNTAYSRSYAAASGASQDAIAEQRPLVDRWISDGRKKNVADWDQWLKIGQMFIDDFQKISQIHVPGIFEIVTKGVKDSVPKKPWWWLGYAVAGAGVLLVVKLIEGHKDE